MSDQLANVLDQMHAASLAAQPPGAPAPAADQNQPKVAFPTDLKLTADQEKKMIEHAFERMGAIGNELGRDSTIQPTWWMNNPSALTSALASQGLAKIGDTFFGKRSRWDASFMGDVSWRPYVMGPETIFSSSNITVPLTRRICAQMIAKAKNAFFGTDPWFSVDPTPVPQMDGGQQEAQDLAIERFCQFKLKESNAKEDHGMAIARALVLGECPVKTRYVVRDQIFNVEATVLVGVDGQPVKGQDGNNITQQDQWQDKQDGAGTQVLARDGITEHPNPLAPIWQKKSLDRRQVLFEGAKSEPIYFKDFLCPLTAPDVQQADCIVHLYDKNVMEFVDLLVKRGMVGDNTGSRQGAAQRIVALVQALSDNNTAPKAAVSAELRPGEGFMAAAPDNTGSAPIAEFAEFYMWYDANEDGVAENIMLIADRKSRTPIYYDSVANVTTDGLRPIEIVRINPVQGRWYGQGIAEKFEPYQMITDLLVNRWNFSQSRSGRVEFWDPSKTQEGDREPGLKMNWGGTYTKKPGYKAEDILELVYLTDVKFEQIHEMIEFFLQLAYNESGVSTANDDQAAGMQSAKLATGILQNAQSGDELFKPIVADLQLPLERLLNREVDVTLANINPEEAYTYLQGDKKQVGRITPEDVRGLKYRCSITLTTHKNQEIIQLSGQAAALVEKFYLLPPDVQTRVAPFYRQQLRALAPSCDVDTTIQPMPPAPPAPPPPKFAVSVAAKVENLTPEERIQVFKDVGVQTDGVAPPLPEGGEGAPKPSGKLGKVESGGTKAMSHTQLLQKNSQPAGNSAPGGTPAK